MNKSIRNTFKILFPALILVAVIAVFAPKDMASVDGHQPAANDLENAAASSSLTAIRPAAVTAGQHLPRISTVVISAKGEYFDRGTSVDFGTDTIKPLLAFPSGDGKLVVLIVVSAGAQPGCYEVSAGGLDGINFRIL